MIRNIVKYGIVLLLAFAIVGTYVAGAQLVSTAFGFPSILQTGTTTAFSRDTAAATDNQAVNVAFPTTTTGIGGMALAFPTIEQTSDQTQTLTHCDFAQNTQTAAMQEPFVGIGAAAIPTTGFGLLGC